MQDINLTQGKVALVDDEDYEWLSQYRWCYHHTGYALRNIYVARKATNKYLHREILGLGSTRDDPVFVDHIDGNKLNCIKSNLRLVTRHQNNMNVTAVRSSTGYKGVKDEQNKGTSFTARIRCNKALLYLGAYRTAEEAARVYDRKAIELFGEYAHTNFPKENYL